MSSRLFRAQDIGSTLLARPNAIEQFAAERAFSALMVIEMMMLDPTVDATVRLKCAEAIVDRAAGRPGISIKTQVTANHGDRAVIEGDLVKAEELANSTALVLQYARQPLHLWPDHVKAAAGYAVDIEFE